MIVEFENEKDYLAAQRILIEMHEASPPKPSVYKLFHFVRDEEVAELKSKMDAQSIQYEEAEA